MVSASSPCGVVDDLRQSLRRTPDRLDPPGLPGPFPDLQRAASETNPEFLFHLLPRIEDSFRTGQALSAGSAGLECRNDRPEFRTSVAFITATKARQRNAMPADAFLAND